MRFLLILVLALIINACTNEPKVEFKEMDLTYPETRKDTVKDDYHGTVIEDPYRWLEDDMSEETAEWVTQQNEVTFNYLEQIPYRKPLIERLSKLWDYEKYSSPFKEGDKYYYFKNDGLQNQSVLYTTDDPGKDGTVLLDPNTFSEEGTSSLAGLSISKDGKYMAYLISEGGSDWRKAKVMNLETGEILSDELDWIKFSGINWLGEGFYYSRYPATEEGSELSNKNEYHSLYYHKLGDSQEDDQLIYRDNDFPQRNVYAGTTEDERYTILYTSESTSGNGIKYINHQSDPNEIITLIDDFENDYSFVDNEGDRLLFRTNKDAPLLKLVSYDTQSKEWNTIIPESEDPLKGISIVGNKIFANYNHNASSQIKVFDMEGNFIQDLELPGIGSSSGISGKKGETEAFYSFTSFTYPNTIFSLNTETLESKVFRSPQVDFDPSQYETKQEWYTSKDGTKVPMFITHTKGLKKDGNNPTLLYGYGGFDISLTPSFSISRLPLLETGGIYVVANIRGGGEFGKDWHEAGTKERKQNVFDDFIAAAEYLIDQKYTSKDKLAIQGGSNGGLLVGTCMTQRPDLFAVAFPAVGVLDMLRYHNFTIGWAWAGDYGKSDDPEAFEYLKAYSPLHNVKETTYPATMITTADHDDRVVPAHSFKFAAEVQSKHQGSNPVLIRIETSAGHGAGKPTDKRIEEAADILSFMFYNTNTEYKTEIKG